MNFHFSSETRNGTPRMNRSNKNERTADDYLIPNPGHLNEGQNSHSPLPTQSPNHLTIPELPRYIISPNSWSPSKKCQDYNSVCVPTKKKDDEEEAYDSGCGGEGGSSVSTSPVLRSSPLRNCELEFSFESPRSLPTANGTTDFSSNQYLQVSPLTKE